MLPYSWMVVFLTSMMVFIFVNSSWWSFFLSPLKTKGVSNPHVFKMKSFWY